VVTVALVNVSFARSSQELAAQTGSAPVKIRIRNPSFILFPFNFRASPALDRCAVWRGLALYDGACRPNNRILKTHTVATYLINANDLNTQQLAFASTVDIAFGDM
jgi:hypothetical protein